LSNGYHRYLSIAGLPQGEWQSATVDMTQMRRPDGSGGSLAADERIDDIQFYVDPRAELLIDDIVLFEAAPPGERRPFPQRTLFTGWFDTGKQGAEWPGEFEIVPHEKPQTWKCARSVPNRAGRPSIRLSLRGDRPLAPIVELSFRYRVRGTETVRVELFKREASLGVVREITDLARDEWSSATLRFELPKNLQPQDRVCVDEVRFVLPSGEMWLDDVLLYVPPES